MPYKLLLQRRETLREGTIDEDVKKKILVLKCLETKPKCYRQKGNCKETKKKIIVKTK